MKKFFRIAAWILGPFLAVWLGLTLWVQQGRMAKPQDFPLANARGHALILYNPDPIYDLDAQLAYSYSEGLLKSGWSSSIVTYEGLQDSVPPRYDLYVIIANTYNWAPDWPTRNFIEAASWLEGRPVVAITLGSGATGRSCRLLKEVLQGRRVKLLDARTFWLLRPNDESRMEESNVEVARDLVRTWAENMGKKGAAPDLALPQGD